MVMRWEGDTIFKGILIADKDNIQGRFRVHRAGNPGGPSVRTSILVNHIPTLDTTYQEIIPEAIRIDQQQLRRFFAFANGSEDNTGKYTGRERGFLVKEIYKSGGREQYEKGKTGKNTFYIVGEPFNIPSPAPELTEEQKKPRIMDITTDIKNGKITLEGLAFNSADSGVETANYQVKFIYPNGVEKIATIRNFSDPRELEEQPEYPEVSDTLWKNMEPASFQDLVPQNTDLERGYYYSLKYDSVSVAPFTSYNSNTYEVVKIYWSVVNLGGYRSISASGRPTTPEGIRLDYFRRDSDAKRKYTTILRQKSTGTLTRMINWRS